MAYEHGPPEYVGEGHDDGDSDPSEQGSPNPGAESPRPYSGRQAPLFPAASASIIPAVTAPIPVLPPLSRQALQQSSLPPLQRRGGAQAVNPDAEQVHASVPERQQQQPQTGTAPPGHMLSLPIPESSAPVQVPVPDQAPAFAPSDALQPGESALPSSATQTENSPSSIIADAILRESAVPLKSAANVPAAPTQASSLGVGQEESTQKGTDHRRTQSQATSAATAENVRAEPPPVQSPTSQVQAGSTFPMAKPASSTGPRALATAPPGVGDVRHLPEAWPLIDPKAKTAIVWSVAGFLMGPPLLPALSVGGLPTGMLVKLPRIHFDGLHSEASSYIVVARPSIAARSRMPSGVFENPLFQIQVRAPMEGAKIISLALAVKAGEFFDGSPLYTVPLAGAKHLPPYFATAIGSWALAQATYDYVDYPALARLSNKELPDGLMSRKASAGSYTYLQDDPLSEPQSTASEPRAGSIGDAKATQQSAYWSQLQPLWLVQRYILSLLGATREWGHADLTLAHPVLSQFGRRIEAIVDGFGTDQNGSVDKFRELALHSKVVAHSLRDPQAAAFLDDPELSSTTQRHLEKILLLLTDLWHTHSTISAFADTLEELARSPIVAAAKARPYVMRSTKSGSWRPLSFGPLDLGDLVDFDAFDLDFDLDEVDTGAGKTGQSLDSTAAETAARDDENLPGLSTVELVFPFPRSTQGDVPSPFPGPGIIAGWPSPKGPNPLPFLPRLFRDSWLERDAYVRASRPESNTHASMYARVWRYGEALASMPVVPPPGARPRIEETGLDMMRHAGLVGGRDARFDVYSQVAAQHPLPASAPAKFWIAAVSIVEGGPILAGALRLARYWVRVYLWDLRVTTDEGRLNWLNVTQVVQRAVALAYVRTYLTELARMRDRALLYLSQP